MDWPGHIDKVTFDTWRQDCKFSRYDDRVCLSRDMWLWIINTLTAEEVMKLPEWGY